MADFDVAGARKEGYSDAEIAEYLSKQNRFNLQGARREGYTDGDIVGFLSGKPAETKPPTFAQKALGAAKEVLAGPDIMAATATGAVAPVAAGLAGIAGAVLPGPTGQGAAWAQKTGEALQYQPRTEIGKAVTGAAAYPFEKLAQAGDVAGGAASEEAGKLLGPKGGAAVGAGVNAAVQGIPLALGAKGAPRVARAAGEVAGKVGDVLTPMPAPEIEALAKKAEAMGIELRPDMLSNNRIAKMIGQALEQVPLSGSKAEQRQVAFNRALTNIIGGDKISERLTPDVYDQAMTKSGEKIGEISRETPIQVTPELRQQFTERVQQADKFETSDVAKIVKNYVIELGAKAGPDSVIPGDAFRKINSEVGRRIRTTSNGDLKNALYELQEDMHDALEKNIASPERLAELKDARYRYAMGKIIEPLVAKAKGGDISPQGLMGAVTSDSAKKTMMARGRAGDIGDLARIGQAFLKEPPSSGTGERLGAYSILTGGAIVEPHTAAAIVGAANLYNRLGPALTKRAIARRKVETPKEKAKPERKSRPAQKAETAKDQYLLRDLLSSEAPQNQQTLKKAVGE